MLGDLNSRTNIATHFEDIFQHEGPILEENPHQHFFEKQGIINRANEDKQLNNNGRKLNELWKMSDLKIVNGRVGKDKHIGNYTCCTSRCKAPLIMLMYPWMFFHQLMIFMLMFLINVCPMCTVLYV